MKDLRNEILEVISNSRRILVAAHIYPDADALGSELALGNILTSLGKEVCLYSEEPVSHILDFLPGSDQLVNTLPPPTSFDCAISLDCGDRHRLGKAVDALLTVHPFVVVDHHTGHKDFGDLRWVDAGRSSTGEMIFALSRQLEVDVSYEAAYCLYAAIVSDTGSFKYSSTTPETFRVAGELLQKGINPQEISGYLFDNFSKNRLQLLQNVLATLELYENDRIAFIHVSRKMFDRTGTCGADTELFINYPRSLSTVKVAIFIKEIDSNMLGVSMRAKGECDVARLADEFGGGGHRNAAGFKIIGETIKSLRLKLLRELIPLV